MKVRKKNVSRISALLLALVMMLSLVPTTVFAAEGADQTTYVLAGGDFQEGDWDANGDGAVTQHEASAQNVSNILAQVSQHYPTMDGFLFTGDYDGDTHGDTQQAAAGITALMNTVQATYPNIDSNNSVLVQGNHDPMISGIHATGGQDFDAYSVYSINEDDYPEAAGDKAHVQTVAENLRTWLAARADSAKPIFVITHVPLAYGTRTYNRGDGKYAKYLFEVLNEAGANGQNIFFLHGHDHAYGCDNPLGGEAIYLPKGDTIRIADVGSQTSYQEYTLNFTYMNSGYVGYYNESGYTIDERDDHKLTMSVFAITDNQVTVERYNAYGLYNMKSAGRDGYYNSESSRASTIHLPINYDVYSSPQTIMLAGVTQTFEDAGGSGISVTTKSGTGLTVNTLANTTVYPNIAKYNLYDITIDGYAEGNKATVSIPVPSDFNAGMTRVYHVKNGVLENMNATVKGGMATFTTNHFSEYMLAEMSPSALEWEEVNQSGGQVYKYELDTNGVDSGSHYLIVAPENDVALADNGSGSGYSNVLSKSVTVSGNIAMVAAADYSLADWTIAKNGTLTGPSVQVGNYTSQSVSSNVTASGNYFYQDGTEYYPVSNATRTSTTSQTATQANVTCNNLRNGNASSWQPTSYYYKDGDNYYHIFAKRSSSGSGSSRTYTYTWGYSTNNNANNVTQIDTQKTKNTGDAPNFTVYNEPTTTTSYSWTIQYTKNGSTVTVSPAPTKQSITLYRYNTTTTSTHDAWTLKAQRGTYLKLGTGDAGDFSYGDASNAAIFPHATEAGLYQLIRYYNASTNADLMYNGSWTTDKVANATNYNHPTAHYVRLYKYVGTDNLPGVHYYVAKAGAEHFEFSTTRFANQSELIAYLKTQIAVFKADDNNGTNQTAVEFDITGSTVNPTAEGSATLNVTYGAKNWPITVTFASKAVTGVTIDQAGTVHVGAMKGTDTGAKIIATFDDGSTEEVPVLLNMVSDGDYNIKKVGTYSGLTVSYGGYDIDFTLNVVVNPHLDPFPKSPNEGSVTINKTATGIDFKNTGVAQVELSARGIPYQRGVDVIVMLDTSSSMRNNVAPLNNESRKSVFAPAFKELIDDLQASTSDIKIAVADFNGFDDYTTGTPSYAYSRDKDTDTLADGVSYDAANYGKLYTGTHKNEAGTAANLNETAFVNVETINSNDMQTTLLNDSTYHSGTNYDYAFWATYQLGASIKAYNEAHDLDRDLVVVFMTDGAPMQYNGYHSNGRSYTWGYWLDGTSNGSSTSYDPADYLQALTKIATSEGSALTTSGVTNTHANDHANYFGGIGTYAQLHRWNEAIKGSSNVSYEVIDKTKNTAEGSNQYLTTVPGLEATVYSVGFALDDDQKTETAHAERVVKQLATSDDYWFIANSASTLNNAFSRIAGDVIEAATDAHFEDEMGAQYDLMMRDFNTLDAEGRVEETKHPSIEVVTYNVWQRSEITDDDYSKVGMRKSNTPTVVERVTFSADGKQAYSNLMGSGNILNNGLIVAKNFVYNTTDSAKTAKINGKTVTVGAESFYWNMGTIQEKEYALRYYVYLTDTMEGHRDAGSYPTNDHATLFYTNYAGADVSQEAPIPVMAWEAAVIKYAAYLVNDAGQPVNAKGEVTSFADRVIVTNPQEGAKVLFNSAGTDVNATVLASVLPDEYTLYDPGAKYTVVVNSGTQAGSWAITRDGAAPTNPNTTYVTGFNGNDYSNNPTDNNNAHNYTATTVWFAVKYTVGAIKDVVVIDYGLPVDISVLSNDMFYDTGALDYVGSLEGVGNPKDVPVNKTARDDFAASMKTNYGTATVHGNYVRYQVDDMNMTEADTFYYAVNYRGNASTLDDDKGYYYGEVTVIPATTIYYEDSFVTFSNEWGTVGNVNATATQDEDRPGTISLTTIDANNIYGFDSAYKECSTYSMGSARKVTVNSSTYTTNEKWPTAQFTFTGTGFDVVSLTSNMTGFLKVDVYQGDTLSGTPYKSWAVDTYYGYDFQENGTNPYVKYTWVYGTDNLWHTTDKQEVTSNVPAAGEKTEVSGTPKVGDTIVSFEKNGEWVKTNSADNALYQIPVIKSEGLTYGKYTVVISAMYSKFFNHTANASYDLYLDAIRIYDPAKNDPTSQAAYVLDNEAMPEYLELRNNLIDADTFAKSGANVTGAVFIDGLDINGTVADYTSYGPNNEVYLSKGQAVAFVLEKGAADVASVQLGVKALSGDAEVKISALGANNTVEAKTVVTKSATDLYYDMTNIAKFDATGKTRIITISNSGDNLVSLTNIKITYVPQTADVASAPARLMMSAPMVKAAADYMNTLYFAAIPEESVEEPVINPAEESDEETAAVNNKDKGKKDKTDKNTKPGKFKPSKMDVALDNDNIKVGDKTTLTVKTSTDVAAVTVNGENAVLAKTDKSMDEAVWTVTAKATEAGAMTNSVVAYDADGIASEEIVSVESVKESRTFGQMIMNFIQWIINWISGWFKG